MGLHGPIIAHFNLRHSAPLPRAIPQGIAVRQPVGRHRGKLGSLCAGLRTLVGMRAREMANRFRRQFDCQASQSWLARQVRVYTRGHWPAPSKARVLTSEQATVALATYSARHPHAWAELKPVSLIRP